jgi:hypothetical protein
MPLERHGVLAGRLTKLVTSRKLDAEDSEAAIHAANVFRHAEEYMEGTRSVSLPLNVLVQAEKVYTRLIGDNV